MTKTIHTCYQFDKYDMIISILILEIIIDQWSPILQHCQQIVSARFVGLEKSLCSKDRVETPEDHHNYNYDYDYDYLEHQKIYEKGTLTKAKLSLAYFKTASSKIGSWLKIFK